jgi:hypothetical protein
MLQPRRTFLGQTALPLPAIAALIRLGRKYDFRNLLEAAVSRLTFENPTTLKEYDALLPEIGKYATTRIVQYPGVFFDMVSLARENDILSVLPAAYYRLVLNGLVRFLPRPLLNMPDYDTRMRYSMAFREMTELWLLSHQLTCVDASVAAKNSHMFSCNRGIRVGGIGPGNLATIVLLNSALRRWRRGSATTWIILV